MTRKRKALLFAVAGVVLCLAAMVLMFVSAQHQQWALATVNAVIMTIAAYCAVVNFNIAGAA